MTTKDKTDVAVREEAHAPTRHAPPQTVMEVFNSDAFRRQVAAALPAHIRPDSMMRIALTEVRKNPDLQKCTVASFMGALLTAAQVGLRPGYNGEGWIVGRWNKKLGCLEAAFQPGYRGLAQLTYRSGEVADIVAEPVYRADHFRYQLGSEARIEHQPDLEAKHRDEDIIAFYAVISLKNGGRIMKVMSKADVDRVRDKLGPRNKAGKLVGAWTEWYESMGCKTALLRALKLAPMESERLSLAVKAEEDALFGDRVAAGVAHVTAAERVAAHLGVDADTGEVIDGETVEEPAIPGEVAADGASGPSEGEDSGELFGGEK